MSREKMSFLKTWGFYVKRLSGERISKLFIVTTASLALILQLTTGVLPLLASTASATGSDNIISQGATSKADLLAIYDRGSDNAGHSDIKQIYTALGVSRNDLANGTIGSYNTNDFGGALKTLGRTNWPNIGRTQLSISGAQTTVFTGPFLDGYNNKTFPMPALIGKRSVDGQWFAITMNCGNIVYVTPPTPPAPPQPLFTCDALTVTPIDRTNVKFNTDYTVKNATFKSVTYVVRNASGTEISRSTSSTYTQPAEGTYSVEAIVTVTVNGQDKTATTSQACTASFTIVKEKTPAIAITKKVDGVKSKTVNLNQEFTYQIHVTNTGESDLTNAVVTDAAPDGVSLIKADVGTVSDNSWTTTIDSLKVDESKDFVITAKVVTQKTGDMVNTACVVASQMPNSKQCDTAVVNVPTPVTPAAITPATPVQLPHTGLGETLSATFGLGSVIASGGYYLASRRRLFSAFIGQ